MELRPCGVQGRGLRAGTLGAWIPETRFIHCELTAFPPWKSPLRAIKQMPAQGLCCPTLVGCLSYRVRFWESMGPGGNDH